MNPNKPFFVSFDATKPPAAPLRHHGLAVHYLLLHGLFGCYRHWQWLLPFLPPHAQTGFFHAWHLPGHHDHAMTLEANFMGYVEKMADFLKAEVAAHGPMTVVGYSLGARLALALAVHAPFLCKELLLIGVHPGIVLDAERQARENSDKAWRACLKKEGLAVFLKKWQHQQLFMGQEKASPQRFAQQQQWRMLLQPEALLAVMQQLSLASMPNFWPSLGGLSMPVRYIVGQQDEKFQAIAQQASSETKNSSYEIVEYCGHNPLLEQPEALAKLLF